MNSKGGFRILEEELDRKLDELVDWLASQSDDHFIRAALLRMTVRDLVHKLADEFSDSVERSELDDQLQVMIGVATDKSKEA